MREGPKIVASLDPELVKWVEALTAVEYAPSVSTVRKQSRRDLSAAQVSVYATSEYGTLHEHTFPDGAVYRENVQRRRSEGENTVSFLFLERGSGECWDALEETIWSAKEMDNYLLYVRILSL